MNRAFLALVVTVAACSPAATPALPADATATADAPALSAEEREVAVVIERMFEAMRAGDGATMDTLFHPDAVLLSVSAEEPPARLSRTSFTDFIAAVGAPHDEVWDERIWDLRVELDGPLATAWMQYAFHLNDRLSHCGVNAIQLYRSEGGWKVIHVADTRRRTDCLVPEGAG